MASIDDRHARDTSESGRRARTELRQAACRRCGDTPQLIARAASPSTAGDKCRQRTLRRRYEEWSGRGHRTNPNATVSMPSGRSQGRPSIRRVTSRSARKACAIPPRLLSWKTRGLRPASPVRSIVTGKVFDRRPLCCSAIRKNWQIASILGSAAMFFGARPTLSEPRPSNRIYEYAPSNLCHSEPWQMVGRSAP